MQIDIRHRRLSPFGKRLRESTFEQLYKFSLKYVREVKRKTPVNTGQLRASIDILGYDKKRVFIKVGSNVKHAIYVEFGRRKGKYPPVEGTRGLEYWVRRKLGYRGRRARQVAFLIARKIAKEGIKGKYMFTETLKQMKPEWRKFVSNIIKKAGK